MNDYTWIDKQEYPAAPIFSNSVEDQDTKECRIYQKEIDDER